jgi:hypothetical protein
MAEAEEKLVLKPGAVTQYLEGLMQSEDSETFFYGEINLQNRRVETLAKSMEVQGSAPMRLVDQQHCGHQST